MPASRGFTLVEVLIALAIVAISLAAFMRLTSQTTSNLGRVEQKTLAMLSAQNAINELRMAPLPPAGRRQLPCPQADQPLICLVTIGAEQSGLRHVSVLVTSSREGDDTLASLETQINDAGR